MITIVTPTFNRKEKLKCLFNSLLQQTDKTFEWLIIDDGSSDGTDNYIKTLNAPFVIKYVRKVNGGKHTALNYSHRFIDGKYVCIVDSDDELAVDAVESINYEINKCEKEKINIAMIIFQRGRRESQKPLDTVLGDKRRVGTLYEFINEGFRGDHCEVILSEYFKMIKFPEFPGEKFMGELWGWLKISEFGRCVLIDKVIYYCEYLEGGLTKSGRLLRIKNPQGGCEHARSLMDEKFNIKIRIKNAILYVVYCRFMGKAFSQIIESINFKFLILSSYIPGVIIYKYWRGKYL